MQPSINWREMAAAGERARASRSLTNVHAVYLQHMQNETPNKDSSCAWQENTRVPRRVLWELLTALP